ncbi:neurotensin/neuromedin N [Callorhinchus milii]|uniref:neurotensin/neuromedin N n=1 Tax=Callorhinchus milii TaxID=7868 RepID=UPI0004575EAA|nr:neurotensin/neuromedin N [Callorhinchus milii]|eukprot:gi/632971018/ref/XP_007901966.1/ PREDICTED: neurotensin/neuromedin N-like [Callorhinchus milii]
MRFQIMCLLSFFSLFGLCSVFAVNTERRSGEDELLGHLYALKLFQKAQDYGDYEDSTFKKAIQAKRRHPYILKRQVRVGKFRRPYILKRNSVFMD